MASTMKAFANTDLISENTLFPTCQTIRIWLEVYLSQNHSAAEPAFCSSTVFAILGDVLQLSQALEKGEGQ